MSEQTKGYWALTEALPHSWRPYAILITMAGFAAALWANSGNSEPVRLVLDVTRLAKLPTHSRGVAGVWWLSIGTPDGIGSMGMCYDTDNEHELDWAGLGKIEVIKCTLTNHSSIPLARVEIKFGVTFQKSVRKANLEVLGGNQYSAGEVLRSGMWPVMFKAILPRETGIFYVCNSKDVFVTVAPPQTATYELMENPKRLTVPLPAVNQHEYLLFNVPEGSGDYAI